MISMEFTSKAWEEANAYVEEQIMNADFNEAKAGVEEYFYNEEITALERQHLMNYISQMKYTYHTRYKSDFNQWRTDLQRF
ncbi:MAG: hypothetical protein ACI4XF_00335 [Oscillospiraceae bacterium]